MTELLLTAVLAALVFGLCWVNTERKGRAKRERWARKEYLPPSEDGPVALWKRKGRAR